MNERANRESCATCARIDGCGRAFVPSIAIDDDGHCDGCMDYVEAERPYAYGEMAQVEPTMEELEVAK